MRDVLAHSAWWIEMQMQHYGVTTHAELRAILEAKREASSQESKP